MQDPTQDVTAGRGGDGDDDDPDEVQLDGGDDGDDFPSGREFPRQISACQRAFLSVWFSASRRRRNISLVAPACLGFSGG